MAVKTGTLVIGRPEDSGYEGSGGIAVAHLYGPRGGEIGSTPINRQNAEGVIARLQSMLAKTSEG